jgi:hypothetical protein
MASAPSLALAAALAFGLLAGSDPEPQRARSGYKDDAAPVDGHDDRIRDRPLARWTASTPTSYIDRDGSAWRTVFPIEEIVGSDSPVPATRRQLQQVGG